MKKSFFVENINTVRFCATYTKQPQIVKDQWDALYFRFLNEFNGSRNFCLDFTMKQGGRDENGFYPNYIRFVCREGAQAENIKSILEGYGFVFAEVTERTQMIQIDSFDDTDIDRYLLDIE